LKLLVSIDPLTLRTRLNNGQWSEWSQSESVWISDAKEGRNTIYVQTRAGDHTEIRETQQTFEVVLPFFQSSKFYWLAGLISLLAISFLVYAFRNNFILQTKNNYNLRQLDFLKVSSLQSQMNPHFVFNALGAIQSPILKGDKELAFSLINKLSSLIRKFLDSSIKSDNSINSVDPHTIKEEIELLKLYVDLEHFQYQDKFQYKFDIAPGLESSEEVIPPFIIQPYIENAIKHGLPQEGNGFIFIKIFIEDDAFHVKIEDNGIGIEAAKKQRKEIDHKSYGTMLTKQRIAILNENGSDIRIDEAERNEGGTIIKIRIKISNKHG
jgi:sensor histidine kinase YesM